MKIAIVGGGAAGLVSAYLLRGRHDVTVFEAANVVGGNIRTLNRNVSCPALDDGLVLDAGVIEFEERKFAGFHRLLDELGVERLAAPGTTALFLRDGRCFRSPGNIFEGTDSIVERIRAYRDLLPLGLAMGRFRRRTAGARSEALYSRPIREYLGEGEHATWLRMLLMYAYSIDYADTGDIPAALAVPMLRTFTASNEWTSIKGGTIVYVQRMIEAMDATLLLDTSVERVTRNARGVVVKTASGDAMPFDKIVFATTPEQVLRLLGDPTPEEADRFAAWRPHQVRTVVHTDTGLYDRRGIRYFSEFDLFETGDGAGYNAYLNRLSGVPRGHPGHYFLAFNLDSEIDPGCILHEQYHQTPSYTVDALRHRPAVIAANGQDHTYYAGAWLGDGLHEGAVQSAMRVSQLLGGRSL